MSVWSKIEVPEESRFLQETQMIGAVSGMVLHIFYVALFAIFQVYSLMWFNIIISVPAFTLALLFSLKGNLRPAPIIGTVEVAIHQVLAVLLLGQESGFQLLLFCMVLTGILFKKWKFALITNTIICFSLFLYFLWFDTGQFIRYDLSVNALRFIKSVNCLGMFTIVGVILYYYIALTKKLQFKFRSTNKKLEESNNNLNSTLNLLNEQKEKIEMQHEIEAEQNKRIKDSITYAQRIQQAVLPSQNFFDKIQLKHFILFKPCDVVSGDFYWFKQIREYLVIAVADCTGHGVPGAFMSMLGVAFLNEIIRRKEVVKSSQVLDILRDEVKLALRQSGGLDDQRDGMDMAFCIINTKTNILQYSGANSPMYIIRKSNELGELENIKTNDIISRDEYSLVQLKADNQPISVFLKEEPFTNFEMTLHKGDRLYLFSDGFQDQFGGKEYKKFMSKNFKKLILNICEKPMSEQKAILDNTFEDWKGTLNKQIDDVLILGLQIP